jgi:hypothetical protein
MGALRMSLSALTTRRTGFWIDVSLGAGLLFVLL